MIFAKYKELQSSSRYFVMMSFLLVVLVLLIAVVTRSSYIEKILTTNVSHKIHTQAQWHIGEILRLDEALTMSARLATSSGELRWSERYQNLVRELDHELLELKNLDPIIYEKFGGQSTQEANDVLVEMELRALKWVKQGKRKDAYALLTGDSYRSHKEAYLNGMLKMREALRDRVDQGALALSDLGKSLLQWGYLATVFFLIALIVSTLVAISSIERNAKVREQSNIVVNQMVLAGELSSLVNHEFKNIITILDYPIRNLKSSVGESVGQSALTTIEKIQSTFSRFNELIRGFSSLGRPSDLKMERVLVQDAIHDMIYFSEYLAKQKGIRFSVEYKGQSKNLAFYGNQVLLTQTLLNLVKNSCDAIEKFSEDSKWVRLEIEEKDGLVQFCVIDGGKGLLEVVKKKLFQDRITTKGSSGTGLGLNISKKFTAIQGGKLEYDDQKENTTFTVTLKAG